LAAAGSLNEVQDMSKQKIAIKLNSSLEASGRGLCDPDDVRNEHIIAKANYGPHGYLEVHESGFIQARIMSGELIQVKPEKTRSRIKSQSRRKSGGQQ
jgi:hypothetical protein